MASENEIPNHERLIIVLGMARSGTTIFTYVLCRHPQIALFRGGPEAWVLENQCLLNRNAQRIGRVAEMFPGAHYVTLKRPWQEEQGEWFQQHLPRARFIVLIRNRESVIKSWQSTGRWAIGNRPLAKTNPDDYYEYFLAHALTLPELVGPDRCQLVKYEDLIDRPKFLFQQLAEWLDLPPLFDLSPLTTGGHWRREYANEFPRGDWLLDR